MSDNDEYEIFKDFVENKLGLRIVETNVNSIKRFLNERLSTLNITVKQYIYTIQTDKEELHRVINKVTINETYFFREQKFYTLLDELIFPQYKALSIIPNIWSAASSIGTEPVSLSLLHNKHWKNDLTKHRVLATDIDYVALNSINENIYSKRLMKNDGNDFHHLIKENSEEKGENIVINDKIIRKIKIQIFNLVKDNYDQIEFAPDIVFLCNILTYMDFDKKNLIINNIIDKMNDNGVLIMSSSDTAFISNERLMLKQYNNSFYFVKKV